MNEEISSMAGELQAEGLQHGQIHPQVTEHYHGHLHGQIEAQARLNQPNDAEEGGRQQEMAQSHRRMEADELAQNDAAGQAVLAVRSHSGVAGDMLLAGLAVLFLEQEQIKPDSPEAESWLNGLCSGIMTALDGAVSLRRATVNGIRGWQLKVNLPHVHEHRRLSDINEIIAQAQMLPDARELAQSCFSLLADCEADAHGLPLEDVHFHEVGALDSILDICACCELYASLGRPPLHCGSLPIADGQVHCAHGILPAPVPAVLRLLRGMPVHPFPGDAHAGELLTPTGVALLRTFGARFGRWPAIQIEATATTYGNKVFADAPNGLIFVSGRMKA